MKRSISIMVIIILLFSLTSCYNQQELEYYSNADNYVTATGEVIHIEYSEDGNSLYLAFSELSPSFDDINFKIVGKNLKIVQANGIDKKLSIGEEVSFITAPEYFGDGYVMPIVAITVDAEVLLEFEQGYENFLVWLEE